MENTNSRQEAQKTLFLRARDAAPLLNVSLSAVYKAMQSGAIPCVRIGTARRIPKKYIEDLLKVG